jgi:hypothetical protein
MVRRMPWRDIEDGIQGLQSEAADRKREEARDRPRR